MIQLAIAVRFRHVPDAAGRKTGVTCQYVLDGDAQHLHVVRALRAAIGLACRPDSRQNHRGEQGDDGNNHCHFDQRPTSVSRVFTACSHREVPCEPTRRPSCVKCTRQNRRVKVNATELSMPALLAQRDGFGPWSPLRSLPYSCPSYSCLLCLPTRSEPEHDQDLGRKMTGRNIKSF